MARFDVDIFTFTSTSEYLHAVAGSGKRNGIRQRMAKHLRCHPTHISQVVKGRVPLSVEFGFELNGFLGHSTAESEYFLLLVQRDGAGTAQLAEYFTAKINKVQGQRQEVSGIIDDTRLAPDQSWLYYTDWSIAAVHIALTVPGVSTEPQLIACLAIDVPTVRHALGVLLKLGLIEKMGTAGEFRTVLNAAHLSSSDPAIVLHHQTWRLKAIGQIHRDPKAGIHYSASASVSREDLKALKALLLETIRQFVERVKPSPPETLIGLTLDLFDLTPALAGSSVGIAAI